MDNLSNIYRVSDEELPQEELCEYCDSFYTPNVTACRCGANRPLSLDAVLDRLEQEFRSDKS